MPSHTQTTDKIFYEKNKLDPDAARKLVDASLQGADDGELFMEYVQSEFFGWDDGRLKTCTYDTDMGFGLRSVAGETFGFAHSSELSEKSIARAGETVKTVQQGHGGTMDLNPHGTNRQLYIDDNPLLGVPFEKKVKLLQDIDAYVRAKDPRVKQVSIQVAATWKAVQILRAGGHKAADIRPLVRMNVSVYLDDGKGRMEDGYYGFGGRYSYDKIFDEKTWKAAADEAHRQASVNLTSIPAPAGEMVVVLGPGWPGILLHEAIGHGLEGDFNRKKTSAFSGLIGKQVASKGVTVVDDGTMPDRRGSITIDDEGTPSQRTTLIEDGILVGYLQDRMNARLMGVKPTGNGRRESYADHVMPRMTNTIMLNGNMSAEEIIKSVPKGLYAVNFGGGQVDITSGKFVFSASEAYLIENGKIGPAVKGATLIGNGPDALTKVKMIGNDMKLDDGVGTCGKDGQSVPVGVGQPTLRIDGLTVGGTKT
ncbi:MAG: metalloprotease TldD [Alphaproteobacteria bacterium]|nr:MAG: metalloprotease TldD [Alphaproteobacteria bacterium]